MQLNNWAIEFAHQLALLHDESLAHQMVYVSFRFKQGLTICSFAQVTELILGGNQGNPFKKKKQHLHAIKPGDDLKFSIKQLPPQAYRLRLPQKLHRTIFQSNTTTN